MDELIKDRLRKVLALAESGAPGEREAAKNMLDKLMKQYNVSIQDIVDETMAKHEFNVGRDKIWHKLLMQVWVQVTDRIDVNFWTRGCCTVIFECTKMEAVEIENRYSIYKQALEKELEDQRDTVFKAFIYKNNIVSNKSSGSDSDVSLTPEEKVKLAKVLHAMEFMERTQIRKQIEG